MLRNTSILLIFIFTSIAALGQNLEQPFDYPVKRGTSEWNSIRTYDSLRKVCQIPSATVDRLGTDALLQSIVRYPLLADVFVFESYQRGIEKFSEHFNAFNALLQRNDLDVTLLNTYTKHLNKNLDSASAFQKGEYSFQMSFLEILINHAFLQNKINITYNDMYLRQLLAAYQKKKSSPYDFGARSLSSCVWAMNGILLKGSASEKFSMKDEFIQRGNTFSDSIREKIVEQVEIFLTQENFQKYK